jgi:hypothetical protein
MPVNGVVDSLFGNFATYKKKGGGKSLKIKASY